MSAQRRSPTTTAAAVLLAAVLLALSACCARGQSSDDCPEGQRTLASAIRGRDDLIFFARALDETGLSASLDGPGPYLVFAPVDTAFSSLESDPQVLELELLKLIQFHVAGKAALDEFETKKFGSSFGIGTLCGDCGDLTVQTSQGDLLIDNRARILEEIPACNGKVVVVDSLLIPEQRSASNPPLGEDAIVCSPDDPACCDLSPPSFSCAEQRAFGKCDEPWMVVGNGDGGFCRLTCGRCGSASDADDYFDYADQSNGVGLDACRCTEDGVSGSVDTGQVGCFKINPEVIVNMATTAGRRIGETLSQYFDKDDSYKFSKYFGDFWTKEAGAWARDNMNGGYTARACYVKDPLACSQSKASSEYIGAGWRRCD